MPPVSGPASESSLPHINSARGSTPKESRFDANQQRVWGASVRPSPPQTRHEGTSPRPPPGAASDVGLPALTPRISAVTLPSSASVPLPAASDPVASEVIPVPPSTAAVTAPRPPSGGRPQSGGRSPAAKAPSAAGTPTVTPGAAAAFADLENENRMLEEIFDDAREIIGIEREMKKVGGEYTIQKRMTSSYEIAAHLGVESAALAPTTSKTYQLQDPYHLARTPSPEAGLASPRQISSTGALAPSPTAMRRLSLAPFLDPNNSPLLSGRRTGVGMPVSESTGFLSSPSAMAPQNHNFTPRSPRSPLSSITTSTPRRYDPHGDKNRYAALFAEQTAMEKQQKESNVQYQSMLETYFKLQEEMKKKLDEDPWEMATNDFEDPIVKNLKRRLSELVGIPLGGDDAADAPAEAA